MTTNLHKCIMADTEDRWSIRQDGCLSLDTIIEDVTYNSLLNAIILSCKNQSVIIVDALSGAVLQNSDLSGHKSENIRCKYLAEKDRTVLSDGSALGVRGDLQGILLLDTALQTPVHKTEQTVKIELPLVEATHLLKAFVVVDLSGKEYVDDFIRDLSNGIRAAQDATQGNHKTAKWATVCLEMQHMALKSVCASLIEELTKTSQKNQGLPVASAIIDRLGFLLPSTRADILKEPVNRALMYSEAARRETFRNWPHMNYKWALPDPMAQAGFFHHPNLYGDDRAMCFTCNVCLVCWEPTDEPWSEHERHSQLCPYIKGDFTQNVPLALTYATQPAHFHGAATQEKISCLSTTFNEDYIATSSKDGNIVVWDISYIVKKHCQFDLDITDALVALKTGLQIEKQGKAGKPGTPKKCAQEEEVKEIPLHTSPPQPDHSQRPSDDMHVTAVCVGETKALEETESPSSKCSPSNSDSRLSVMCGVSLRRTKSSQKQLDTHAVTGSSRTVQLMNEVNETVSSESCDPRLITDRGYGGDAGDFHLPESQLVPYIVVVSLVEHVQHVEQQSSPKTKKKVSSSPVPVKSGPPVKDSEGSGTPPGVANNTDEWAMPWEYDSDCQIVGYTPAPGKPNFSPFTGTFATSSSADEVKNNMSNGPSDIFCDNVDSSLAEPITPTKPFSFSFANTSNSSTNSVARRTNNSSPKKEVPVVSGMVVQCIDLPKSFQKEGLEITHLIPTLDKQHVVVVLSTKVGFLESLPLSDSQQQPNSDSLAPSQTSSKGSSGGQQYCGGGILLYRVKGEGLEESPVSQMAINSPREVITNVLMLPTELEDQLEEQSMNLGHQRRPTAVTTREGGSVYPPGGITGHIVITTACGAFKVLSLSSFVELACVPAGPSEKFVSSVYCSGIERLCVCSDNGKLYFYDLDTLGDQQTWPLTSVDVVDGPEGQQEGTAIKRAKLDEDVVEHPGSDYLTKHSLTPDTLTQLHTLTQFENLMPRFTAVVPPCWSEIQQEQQQRRHPQHLQQQGEATQHTRTWKLSADAGHTWDEHLMEILLPKPCAVGHVDVKFSLNPLYTSQPNIEVTLLKQNIGSMHNAPTSTTSGSQNKTPPTIADSGHVGATADAKDVQAGAKKPTANNMVNNVLDPKFLDSLKAEILCGPVKLANCLDLSGSGGLITLTSSQLLNSKPRSLLLHIKGFENSPLLEPFLMTAKEKTDSRSSIEKMIQKAKRKNLGMVKSMLDEKHHNIKGIFDSVTQTTVTAGNGGEKSSSTSSSSGKQKMATIKGCDWFQEISVTVRVFKKLNICNEKLQRNSMIQDWAFHRRLLQQLVSPHAGNDGVMMPFASSEHVKNMVLDILIWILSLQTNDLNNRSDAEALLHIIQEDLKGIVASSFIMGSRTTAHKCSRLLILCMESFKNSTDPNLAPAFSQNILNALLASYPMLPMCKSSGAMRWFFAIFNRVKCMDIELVAEKTCQILQAVSQEYSSRTLPLQALLKTRYGLCGNPFEAELFDMEIAGITKSTPTTTTAAPRANPLSACLKTGAATTTAVGNEHLGLYEMLTSIPDKAAKNQPECLRNDILGLLEVEPLHFRCHATSDGTRMERLDTSASLAGGGGSSSILNPTPSYLIPFQTLGPDDITAAGSASGDMSSIFSQTVAASSKLAAHSATEMFKAKKSLLGPKTYMGPSKLQQGGKLFQQLHLWKQQLEGQAQASQSGQGQTKALPKHPVIPVMIPSQIQQQQQKLSISNSSNNTPHPKQIALPQMHGLLQSPAPQVLIIERMHSGARRFVTLDFGKPIVLTDVVIPCSNDLASLSIDVWVEGEEVDGQRLVVASDIGTRALVMNNIMPAPVCRYLKITTVGRYSGGTTRSRIRLGSFYGHTYILPWEWPDTALSHTNTPPPQSSSSSPHHKTTRNTGSSSFKASSSTKRATNSCGNSDANKSGEATSSYSNQTPLLSQLGLFLSLMEDLQCRFNLARNRMESLLTSARNVQHLSAHVQYHLKRTATCKLSEEDSYIIQAYNECMQLQLQMNLAQRAIHRLQTSLGITADSLHETVDFSASLKKSSTDKLRVILENLLDLLLTSTVGSPAIPQPPVTLYNALTPHGAESLFQHLCLHGTQRIHVSAGLLLVRICGTQDWWGNFLGKMIQSFFHSKCAEIFPQDRVFVLLCSLGQKSLCGPSSQNILDSLLGLLTTILKPLHDRHTLGRRPPDLDLSLISWVLLFLCRNMDCSSSQPLSTNTDDAEKGAKKDKEACSYSSRWSFIDNQCSGGNASSAKAKAPRLHRRGFQRKIALCRQKIHDKASTLSKADKNKLSSSKGGIRLEEDTGEEREGSDSPLTMSRERCLAVVQGLMALILSMDFTCHVDLYLIACKVLSKICLACRPSITLAEAATQDQLERLMLLVVGSEFNHDHVTWGGPWACHAITCLLQDILEGEKVYSSSSDDLDGSDMTDVELSIQYNQWLDKEGIACDKRTSKQSIVVLPDQVEICLRQKPELYKYFKRDFLKGNICIDEKEDPILVVSMFVNKKDKDKWNKFLEAITRHQIISSSTPSPPPPPPYSSTTGGSAADVVSSDFVMEPAASSSASSSSSSSTTTTTAGASSNGNATEQLPSWVDKSLLGFQQMDSNSTLSGSTPTSTSNSVQDSAGADSEKISMLGVKKPNGMPVHAAISDLCAQAISHGICQGLSTALDARLEFGLETMPEHRLKVIQSVQLNNIQCAFSSPLPSMPSAFSTPTPVPHTPAFSDREDISSTETTGMADDTQNTNPPVSSIEMLSQSFELVFGQLCSRKVNLESALQMWLTLNEEGACSDSSIGGGTSSSGASNSCGGSNVSGGTSAFDATRQPVITLSENAVASLMEVGVMTPCLPVRMWVYMFQSLCLLTNQRLAANPNGGSGRVEGSSSLASCVLNNPHLAPLLTKFLSSHNLSGTLSGGGGMHQYQAGSAAVKVFGDFLYRLECRSIEGDGRNNFKEMLLKMVYNLTAERGAVYQCMGPIDAQVRFVEMLSENVPLNTDVGNTLSVIQTVTTLVHHHISFQEQVACRTSQNSCLDARTCFGGLVASLLRGNDSKPSGSDNLRNLLMFYLLQLVNKLILTSVPSKSTTNTSPTNCTGNVTSSKVTSTESSGSWDAFLPGAGPSAVSKKWPESQTAAQDPFRNMAVAPNIRLSDDEKSRSQLQELTMNIQSGTDDEEDGCESLPTSEIADIVVGNPVIMASLIEALSYCTSTRLALMFAQTDNLINLQKTADQTEAVTVGDLVFTILKNIQAKCSDRGAMVDHLFKFFVGTASSWSQSALTRISEPLLFFALRALCSYLTVKKFHDLGGISVICTNFVRCNKQMISATPSLISTFMQNFTQGQADLSDKTKGVEADLTDGLHNFAHLGTITSSSPTASPADGLIQTIANRRARSATWSYHFYPDEPCVELTIHLPFAVLLKYVHIRPHGGAISVCPSNVSLELSHDGTVVSSACPPMVTSSLSLIRLQLVKPEVVTAITILLYKPKDSMAIGLQNISLWGQTAFSDGADQVMSLLNEEGFSRSSLGWMRILHHCLVMSPDHMQSVIAHAAASIPNLLATCTSLLVHPQIGIHAPKIETILIKIGLCDSTIGLALLDSILGGHRHSDGQHSFLGKISGVSSPFTVEILFRLGTTQDDNVQARVQKLIEWLRECSTSAQEYHRMEQTFVPTGGPRIASANPDSPAPEHVQCVAAVLWHSAELPVSYPLQSLVPVDFIRSMYDWAMVVPDSNLRKAVTNVLCSASHISTQGYLHMQEWMGIVDAATGSQVVGDDGHDMRPGRMTDDSKGANLYNQDGLTDDSKEARRLQSLNTMNLDEGKLMLLASACKSPAAMRQLMNSGLPSILAQAVCEFCSHQMMLHALLQAPDDGDDLEEEGHTEPGDSRGSISGDENLGGVSTFVTASLVSSILRFFTEISTELEVKEWLGQAEGNAFWSLLLTLLCGAQYQMPCMTSNTHHWTRLMTGEERCELETRTIQFFTSVIWFHSENQLLFAKVLCEVIKDQGITKTDLLSAMPLSGFMRRLLLQVLLEDEKITVAIRLNATSGNSTEEECVAAESLSFPLSVHEGRIFHPRYGCGRSCQCITMNFHSKCSEVIAKVADTVPMSTIWPEKKEEKKKRFADYKKEALGELDVDMLELISHSAAASAASAKEKRMKNPLNKSGLPPRPPTRRGRQNGNVDSMDSSGYFGRARLQHVALPGKDLPSNLTLSQLYQVLSEYALLPPAMTLQFMARVRPHPSLFKDNPVETIASDEALLSSPPFQSALKVFASVGGLALLAEHLPLLFPEISRQSNNIELVADNNVADIGHDWVTVESSDELYDTYYDSIPAPQMAKSNKHSLMGPPPSIPPHSLIAFGLFLRLPGYAEVLLKERKTGQCLLRLVLGVTDDGDGGQILTSPIAASLPTMPFTVLQTLFDSSPLTTDDGVVLRRMSLDIGVVHLVLACLSTLSHHKPRAPLTSFQHETQLILSAMQSSSTITSLNQPEEKGQQHYWAKGTGFGTGSTTSSWDAEQAMLRQKGEEEHVACLLQVLASYINPNTSPDTCKSSSSSSTSSSSSSSSTPGDPTTSLPDTKNMVPEALADLLAQSCLVPAVSSYLRNDSVLDMARHVPLYRALLQLLRGITVTPSLVSILMPMDKEGGGAGSNGDSQTSIEALLEKMKGCVDTYASRLKSNRGKSDNKLEDEESEGLALLIPDIQKTAQHVRMATQKLKDLADEVDKRNGSPSGDNPQKCVQTVEEKYLATMKELQFDTFELVTEEGRSLKFNVSHHYESNVKAMGAVNNVARTRRLAQEAVTLSTSLPLAYSSSVFVRCDEERLDVMKVLITGPCDTPYANGCFEFDVFFPQDYPNSPPFINMETTGNHSVRFNPNLYNDGKVCLSVLNTWHGRPEEKWNAQTSSFLQVLVSIQSLILVSEPYFNEPGYERSRGTPSGAASSHEYDANIRQATVKWAMLEQLKKPSSCFKDIVHTHFWLKRHEVLEQCETWISEMETYSNDKRTGRSIAQSTLSLKRHYNQMREELSKLKPPAKLNLEDDELTQGEIDPDGKHYETTVTPIINHRPRGQHKGPPTPIMVGGSQQNSIPKDVHAPDSFLHSGPPIDVNSPDSFLHSGPPIDVNSPDSFLHSGPPIDVNSPDSFLHSGPPIDINSPDSFLHSGPPIDVNSPDSFLHSGPPIDVNSPDSFLHSGPPIDVHAPDSFLHSGHNEEPEPIPASSTVAMSLLSSVLVPELDDLDDTSGETLDSTSNPEC